MNKTIALLLSAAVSVLAARVQVLKPTGAAFAPDAPQMVQSIARAAVGQSGNTPVDGEGDVQLRTSLMTMGTSIVVVCEQVKDGTVLGSGKEKASSLENLDAAIESAVMAALGQTSISEAAPAPQSVIIVTSEERKPENPDDNFSHKRPTRNYASYGLGMALWHNWDNKKYNKTLDWDKAFVFHYGRIFEATSQGAITIMNNMDFTFSDDFQWHETFLIGGRFFFSTGTVSPYVGAGAGIGLQVDDRMDSDHDFAAGLAVGGELGLVCFRNSAAQLEIGFAWDALWDGFDNFGHRFGAGSAYIAINY